MGGDFGLFQAGRCRLIGEHQKRPAKPLTQSTHTLHLLAGRVDAAPSWQAIVFGVALAYTPAAVFIAFILQ
jgi:hypothetical protein